MEDLVNNMTLLNTKSASLTFLLNIIAQTYFLDYNRVVQLVNDPVKSVSIDMPSYIWHTNENFIVSTNLINDFIFDVSVEKYFIVIDGTINFFNIFKDTAPCHIDFKVILVLIDGSDDDDLYRRLFSVFMNSCVLYQTVLIRYVPGRYELFEGEEMLYGENYDTGHILDHLVLVSEWDINTNKFIPKVPTLFKAKRNVEVMIPDVFFSDFTADVFLINEFEERYDYIFQYNRFMRYEAFESYPLGYFSKVLTIPKPRIVENWFSYIMIFELKLWLFIIVSYIFGNIYFHILRRITPEASAPNWIIVLGMSLGQSIPNNSSLKRLIPKLVQMLLFSLTLLFAAMFSSTIVSNMISPYYEGKYKSVQQVYEANLMVQDHTDFLQYLFPEDDNHWEKYNRMMSNAESNGRMGYYIKISEYLKLPLEIPFGMPSNCCIILHEVIKIEHYTVKLARNSPILPHLNKFIFRVMDAGLLNKWEVDAYIEGHSIFDMLSLMDQSVPPLELTVLTLSHLKGLFALWVICAGVSFFGLVGEICVAWISNQWIFITTSRIF